jgi:hypothetical protein
MTTSFRFRGNWGNPRTSWWPNSRSRPNCGAGAGTVQHKSYHPWGEFSSGATHAAANNQVCWSLQVRGKAAILPVWLDFAVIVYPAGGAPHESA